MKTRTFVNSQAFYMIVKTPLFALITIIIAIVLSVMLTNNVKITTYATVKGEWVYNQESYEVFRFDMSEDQKNTFSQNVLVYTDGNKQSYQIDNFMFQENVLYVYIDMQFLDDHGISDQPYMHLQWVSGKESMFGYFRRGAYNEN